MKYYDDVWGEQEKKEKISPSCYNSSDLNIVNHETKNRFLVNHDQKEYLDLGCYIERCTVKKGNCWLLRKSAPASHGLRQRTRWWRFSQLAEYCWLWKRRNLAFDMLELSKQRPDGYAEIHYTFIEGAIWSVIDVGTTTGLWLPVLDIIPVHFATI